MVIQRIQTLWLLVALILTALIGIRPFAWQADTAIFLTDSPVLLVIDILIGMLLLISIFSFKNLKLQKKITALSIVMMFVLAIGGGFYLYRNAAGATLEIFGGVLLLGVAAVFALLAIRGMSSDQRKLRNADRLWS